MRCLVIVAHPDDEAIWMGGTIIRQNQWDWHILSLCRATDPDRAPRFFEAARFFGAHGYMSDLDDSPTLASLSPDLTEIKARCLQLADLSFNFIFTHGERGEYTRHERHEQVHRAVRDMICSNQLFGEMVTFAYDDCGGVCTPGPVDDAHIRIHLRPDEFAAKLHVIKDIYGFNENSFEFRSAGPVEAFRTNADTLPLIGDEMTRICIAPIREENS